MSDKIVDRLARGVALEDGPAKFDAIERIGGNEDGSHDWFRVLLKEGRNREVRRLWESQGLPGLAPQARALRQRRTAAAAAARPGAGIAGRTRGSAAPRIRPGTGTAAGADAAAGGRPAPRQQVHAARRRRTPPAALRQRPQRAADEGRELRRFDHVREDRGRRGQRKPHGGLTVSGEQAPSSRRSRSSSARTSIRALPDGNPAAFRSWYVP